MKSHFTMSTEMKEVDSLSTVYYNL